MDSVPVCRRPGVSEPVFPKRLAAPLAATWVLGQRPARSQPPTWETQRARRGSNPQPSDPSAIPTGPSDDVEWRFAVRRVIPNPVLYLSRGVPIGVPTPVGPGRSEIVVVSVSRSPRRRHSEGVAPSPGHGASGVRQSDGGRLRCAATPSEVSPLPAETAELLGCRGHSSFSTQLPSTVLLADVPAFRARLSGGRLQATDRGVRIRIRPRPPMASILAGGSHR